MGRLSVIALLLALGLSALWLLTKRNTTPHAIERTEVPAIDPETVHELASAPPLASPTPAARVPVPATSTAPAERDVRDPSLAAAVRASSRASIAGRVVRPDGAPVAGAEVAFECPEPFRSKLGPLARTQTGSDGRFELPCAYAGAFRILATERVKDRVTARAVRDDVYPGRRDLEIVLQPALVRGRVVDDLARPVTDFRITWRPLHPDARDETSGSGERFHGPSGKFTSSLSPGGWRASVSARGDFVSAEIELVVPAVAPQTIVVARRGIVRGKVVDDAGVPVPRAEVIAPENDLLAASEADGSFVLKVRPDRPISLWAEAIDRGAPSETLQLVLAPGEERKDVVLRLGGLARVTGEVIDPLGRPVSGREVSIYQEPGRGVRSPRAETRNFETDSSGRFEARVPPGRLYVSVEFDFEELRLLGRLSGSTVTSRLSCERCVTVAGGETAHVRLVMGGSPVRLHGKIDVGGRPPTRARVDVFGRGTGEQNASFADGRYEVLVPEPGVYRLLIVVDEMSVQPSVDVPEGEEFCFDVSIPIGRLAGHVRNEAGTPLEGAVVDAMSQGEQPVRSSGRATTDRAGAYAMELLPATYRLSPRTDFEKQRSLREPEPQIVSVEPDSERGDVDFVLQSIGAIDGIVRGPDGGILARASISVREGRPDSRHSGSADRDGRFHLPLDGGTYWLSAVWREGEANLALPEPLRVELLPGAVQTFELRLVACTEVWVSLLDADGHPALADLEALDDRGHSFDALSRGRGVQTLMLVPPGHYELRARVDDRVFQRELSLPAGETQVSVEFRL